MRPAAGPHGNDSPLPMVVADPRSAGWPSLSTESTFERREGPDNSPRAATTIQGARHETIIRAFRALPTGFWGWYGFHMALDAFLSAKAGVECGSVLVCYWPRAEE